MPTTQPNDPIPYRHVWEADNYLGLMFCTCCGAHTEDGVRITPAT